MVETEPLVWLLLGERLGDNAQVRSLGRLLGFPMEEKYLRYNRLYHIPNGLKGASLVSVQRDLRGELAPPWPDIVISSGRKSVAAARWIRKQSKNKTKLVAIGRPRVALDIFDLVVTTPQYRIPREENVFELSIPLSGVAEEDLSNAGKLWSSHVADLPEPRIALLVGGDTSTSRFDDVAADRLGRLASRYARSSGGSLMVTTSPRTGVKAADALINAISVPAKIHRWAPGQAAPNPYLGFLGLADEVIVTCDSASMIADAGAAKKQVLLFDVPMRPRNPVIDVQHRLYLRLEKQAARGVEPNWYGRLLHWLAYQGYLTPPRNMQRLYHNVVATGQAHWLVDACVDGKLVRPLRNDAMARTIDELVVRIRSMATGKGGAAKAGSLPELDRKGGRGLG